MRISDWSSDVCSSDLARIAQDEWGFLTPRKARSGGKPLDRSTLYKMLKHPFSMGVIEWCGVRHQGSHEPMLTETEFERVQALLAQSGVTRPVRYIFASTALIVCGACGRDRKRVV